MLHLDDIFKKRIGGASNFAGINYQIIYSLWKSLDMYEANPTFTDIQLEGIEDVDIKRLNTNKQIFIQVKTSKNKWHWSYLKEKDILKNFAEVYGENVQFELVIGATVSGEVLKINDYPQLEKSVKSKFEKDFIKIFLDSTTKSFTDEQILALLSTITIQNIRQETLELELKQKLYRCFDIQSAALLEFYQYSFAYKFVEWAKERRKITKLDLEQLHLSIQEGWARHERFGSFAKSLIDRVDWTADKKPNDFLEGRKTRFGHIVDNLDIRREIWLDKIHQAFTNNNICVIKSSSGQGKSAIAFRYVFENWQQTYTYIIKCVRTQEQAAEIANYIGYLANLGLPIKILIDDVTDDVGALDAILATCAAKKIDTLLTIRIEDDSRLSRIGLTDYEVVIPTLNLLEAKKIYHQLKVQKKLANENLHPERAFEAIGEKGLLMEYIYLLTAGKMLQEKLMDQIKEMRRRNEVAKIEVLRRIVSADTLYAPLESEKFIETLSNPVDHDYQGILQELIGEFIELDDNGLIRGLHPLRSRKLATILHDNYKNIAHSALNVLEFVPLHYVISFVRNALIYENLDNDIFLSKIRNKYFTSLVSFGEWHHQILQGIFEGGEYLFFFKNKLIFDRAYELGGGDTIFFTSQLASSNPIDPIGKILNTLGNDNIAKVFSEMKALLPTLDMSNRGLELVSSFLANISSHLKDTDLIAPLKFGKLMDWFALVRLELPNWKNILVKVMEFCPSESTPSESFSEFSQGLYRYAPKTYQKWFSINQIKIIDYLENFLDCIKISIIRNECYMTYNSEVITESFANKATMNRLRYLRMTLPFCEVYHGNNLFLKSLKLGYNPSEKHIRQELIPYKLDIIKNNILTDIADKEYNPKTWHEFQYLFYELRKDLIWTLDILSKQLGQELQGKPFDFKAATKNKPIRGKLMYPHKTPTPINEKLTKQFEEARYAFLSIQNCFSQLNVTPLKNMNIELLLSNYSDYLEKLPIMQVFFNQIHEITFPYYDFKSLNQQEYQISKLFKQRLEQLGSVLKRVYGK